MIILNDDDPVLSRAEGPQEKRFIRVIMDLEKACEDGKVMSQVRTTGLWDMWKATEN